jgi:FtsZ-binding cell division protein ZapB
MENTTVFKNIECNVTQLATTITLISSYIKEQKEMIELYKDELNGSDNTEQVRFYQTAIKDKKANIKSMIALQVQMATKELITKHTL